jgi:hypothetical protein
MDIMKVTDVALKATDVKPGMMIIERLYGMLEVHSDSQADVRQAGAAILAALDLKEEDRIKPEITSSQVIRNISDYHSQLINRTAARGPDRPGRDALRPRVRARRLRRHRRERGGEGGEHQRPRGARLRQLRARLPRGRGEGRGRGLAGRRGSPEHHLRPHAEARPGIARNHRTDETR